MVSHALIVLLIPGHKMETVDVKLINAKVIIKLL